MRVFLAGTSLRLDYGGPAYSVARLAVALAEAGVEVGIWSPDNTRHAWSLPLSARLTPLQGSATEALTSFGAVDVIHDNGIWLAHNHLLALEAQKRGVARIVSTRGMLEPWALNHKRAKKCVAWWWYQRSDLRRARCHHATSEAEADNLRRLHLGVRVCVIPNGIDLPPTHSAAGAAGRENRPDDRKTALFLGRLYPVKGLPMLIEAWSRTRPAGWRLQIAGPDEADHRKELERRVAAAGLTSEVSFLGPLSGPSKHATLWNASLFVLPTHSESFGIAIAEALAHGLPVLTTKGAPWAMLGQRGCGWWVDPSVDGIAEGLRVSTALDADTLRAMGSKGHQWMEADFAWCRVAEQFLELYQEVAAG